MYPFCVLVRLWSSFKGKGHDMTKTVGTTDRVVRGVVALGALVASGFAGFASGWGIVLLVVAAIAAVTGASGYCPLYSALGVNTCGAAGCGTHRGTVHHASGRTA